MKDAKTIIVVECGVVQNIISSQEIGQVFLVDYDNINDGVFFYNLDEKIVTTYGIEINKEEVDKLLNMTYRDFLEEYNPKLLKELEEELHEFENEQWEKDQKRISD